MKRTLWNITLASVLTLVAYVAFYTIWGAILSEVKSQSLRLVLISVMTTIAFGFLLLYTSKIIKSTGEDEVMSDYKDKKYISFAEDFKIIIKRESKTLTCIAAIILICFALGNIDNMVFGKKIFSLPTILFVPMFLFGSLFEIPFIGYVLSIILDCATYIVVLLFFRKKKYNYWMKKKT